MCFDYLNLGSSPYEEDCIQVSQYIDYIIPMKQECNRFKELLENKFPIPQNLIGQVYFKIKTYHHDFGDYSEVAIIFNDNIDEAIQFVYNVESNLPATWE